MLYAFNERMTAKYFSLITFVSLSFGCLSDSDEIEIADDFADIQCTRAGSGSDISEQQKPVAQIPELGKPMNEIVNQLASGIAPDEVFDFILGCSDEYTLSETKTMSVFPCLSSLEPYESSTGYISISVFDSSLKTVVSYFDDDEDTVADLQVSEATMNTLSQRSSKNGQVYETVSTKEIPIDKPGCPSFGETIKTLEDDDRDGYYDTLSIINKS